jgi:ribonuclease E
MSDAPEGVVRTAPGGHPDEERTEGAAAPSQAARRRRRRGGRGRGRGGGAKPATEAGQTAEASEAAEASAGARGEARGPETTEAAEGALRGAPEGGTTARRRRHRGGRGRGHSRRPAAGTQGETAEGPAEPTLGTPASPASPAEATEPGQTPGAPAGAEPAQARRPRRRRTGRKPVTAGEPAGDGSQAAVAAAAGVAADGETAAPAAEGEPRPTRSRTRARSRKPAGDAKPKQEPRTGAKPSTKEAAEPEEAPKEPKARRSRTRTKSEDRGAPTRTRRARTPGRRRRDEVPLPPRVHDKVMLITEHGERDQIAVLEDRELVEHYITRAGAHSLVGNIFLGRVQNVLPGMEAAFIDIGRGRNAVLYAGEVSYDEEIEGRPPRIEQVIRPGQAVLTQVTKDPIGGKGPRLTQEISLPGRYLVLVPNSEVFGISRRLPDEERRRLKAAVKKVRPEQHGVIVRTAAEGAGEAELAADVQRLVGEWEAIAKRAKKVKAPHVLYEEPELTVRVVRDLFTDEEFKEMVTDSQRVHELVTGYLRDVAPDLAERVNLYDGKLPLLEHHHVTEQIHKALERKVWLPSGGYIIIERTEAMTVIDVNTGKHVGKHNLEETVVKTNLEAAEEIARQLRLRDIGGIIIIDFIDMLLEQNKDHVIDTMRQALARDKTRSQVFSISPLGILEVTRKRVSAGLLESFSETCPTCGGRGILLTHEI